MTNGNEPERQPTGDSCEHDKVLHCAICEGKPVTANTPICEMHYQRFVANMYRSNREQRYGTKVHANGMKQLSLFTQEGIAS